MQQCYLPLLFHCISSPLLCDRPPHNLVASTTAICLAHDFVGWQFGRGLLVVLLVRTGLCSRLPGSFMLLHSCEVGWQDQLFWDGQPEGCLNLLSACSLTHQQTSLSLFTWCLGSKKSQRASLWEQAQVSFQVFVCHLCSCPTDQSQVTWSVQIQVMNQKSKDQWEEPPCKDVDTGWRRTHGHLSNLPHSQTTK